VLLFLVLYLFFLLAWRLNKQQTTTFTNVKQPKLQCPTSTTCPQPPSPTHYCQLKNLTYKIKLRFHTQLSQLCPSFLFFSFPIPPHGFLALYVVSSSLIASSIPSPMSQKLLNLKTPKKSNIIYSSCILSYFMPSLMPKKCSTI
jgi:hypothetical protein